MDQIASVPFEFESRLNLTLLTGLKASDLAQLVENLRIVAGSVLFRADHVESALEASSGYRQRGRRDFAMSGRLGLIGQARARA
jgi:hypothetical protein